MKIDLSIIIVSYNAIQYLKKCLDSIYRYTSGINFEVFVVDNASSEGNPEMVEKFYSDVILIKNNTNLGFSKANNLAIRKAKGRYIVLLNSDTEFLDNAFKKMVVFMDKHPEAGAIRPKTWANPEKTFLLCGAQHFSPKLLLFHSTPLGKIMPNNKTYVLYWEEDLKMVLCNSFCEVDTVSGHCFMVRREAVEKCGMLDEKFFFYFEDADWSIRIKTEGWKLYHLAEAEIVHYLWKSSGDRTITSIYYKNSLNIFMKKHYGMKGFLTVKGLSLMNTMKKYIPFKRSIKWLLGEFSEQGISILYDRQDLRITWNDNVPEGASCFIFQLSYCQDFIPSGSKRIRSDGIQLSGSFMSTLPDGIFFWRVIPEGYRFVSTAATSCFLKKT